MTLDMDPRLVERRKEVREQSARGAIRKLLWLLASAAVVGAALWLVQSPFLSISQLVVHGAKAARVASILSEEGVALGRPLLTVRPGRVEAALEADPWISQASVSLVFPDTVEIDVREREAAAWLVGTPGGLVASDGVVLTEGGTRSQTDHVIDLDTDLGAPGELHPDPRVMGAVTFLSGLGARAPSPVTVTEQAGELWADLGSVRARLGRPTGMEAKAAALLATLEAGVGEGSIIVLIAPTRPSVIEP